MTKFTNQSFSQRLATILQSHPTRYLMRNVVADIDTYECKGQTIISTVVHRIQPNCYVVSPYAGIVDYAKDELIKLPLLHKILARSLIAVLSAGLRLARIDTLQTLNNHLLSTNLLNRAFMQLDFSQLVHMACQRYPQHALLIRSLNECQHDVLLQQLKQQGWLPVVSRQVYFINDMTAAMQRRDTRSDQRLLNDTRYTFYGVDVENITDFQQAERLYNTLYLDKYSRHNVQFTAEYLQALVKADLLHLQLLHDADNNQVVGVVGVVEEDGVITTPILGYDTGYPQKAALYRRLNAYVMRYSEKRGTVMHLSSGAPTFKKQRGASPYLEYSAVYVAHLPWLRRKFWQLLSTISQKYYGELLVGEAL